MTDTTTTQNPDDDMALPVKANERPKHGPGRQMGPGGHGMGTGEKAANFGVSARRLIRNLAPQRVAIITAIVLGTLSVALAVVGPKILGLATDKMLEGIIGKQFPATATKEQIIQGAESQGQTELADLLRNLNFTPGEGIDFGAIGTILLLVLGLYVASFAFSYLQGWILNGAVQRTIYDMRQRVSAKLDRLPLRYFDKQPRGEVLSRVTNDIDNVSQTLQQTLSQLLNSLLMVVGVLIMMFWISPTLALVALVSIPVAVLITAIIGKRSQKLFAQNWKSTGELNAHIEEAFTGHALVKVFGRQKEVEAVFAERNDELYKAGFGAQFISGIIMPLMFFVGNLNYVVIAVLGGLRVATGQMNIGDVQAFIQYSRQFTQPLTQVASMANLMQSGVASAERVFELLDAEEMTGLDTFAESGQAQSAGQSGAPVNVTGRVEFEHVDFSYSPDKPLIRDLSLTAEPGQTVAIVGPTGAGKTTLVNLIMRFYDLDSGRITIDGVDIAMLPRGEVRRNIGMVLQDTWLFGGTIWDNIAYGRPDATPEEIIEAAKATFVDRFVHSLPDGYDTVIDEEGSNVSAGEKQLITIARAFLADPALLILDEATSSVDTRTELLLQHAMAALRTGRTSFVIAHRLSTIRDADLILVMEDGAIVEKGNHHELLAAEGAYYDLYQSQFAAAIED
ncbi:ABC transporter ATP-binding protein [Tessaracoccus sp. ZS01]|uniref:ABC transporter ATP-binding protein n=1 Tax=Tessaracoccus sp. ZS01 TaxID=1906324 RepID=UPI00096CC3D6|nr:ABC transporter ATP-binding protein [Tessaracoccus sp. ZS01]MCG6568153.1 ABC transporter ATP-binding protein [Tessaracoccus sp. ZS01]OMG54075.1 multidrug ABC transporter ATP-binding protein [Tessaracoccus sp. ZS01]